MKFYQTTLENGLTIVGEQRSTAVSVAIGIFARTGARDEKPEEAGVSHFLEHMMFKGTEKRTALDITYQLGALGAQANAFTSEENTVYYMAVLPEYFTDAVELLCDMLRPSLAPEEFDIEKKVILEEIALYQDRPTFLLFESAIRSFFGSHPAGNSVLGTTDTISALSRNQMKAYFDRRYRASNLVLVATGNFDWKELVAMAEQYCASWPDEGDMRERPVHTPVSVEKVLTKDDLQRAHVCLVAPGPSAKERSRYPVGVLSCILGDSTGSRAYWELVDKGLADSASIDSDEMDGTGMIYGYASATPERLDQVAETLRSVMSSPGEIDQDALDRAQTKLATRLVLQGESSMRRLMAVGINWIYRSEYLTLQEELERIQSVTREEIQESVQQYDFAPTAEVKLIPA